MRTGTRSPRTTSISRRLPAGSAEHAAESRQDGSALAILERVGCWFVECDSGGGDEEPVADQAANGWEVRRDELGVVSVEQER